MEHASSKTYFREIELNGTDSLSKVAQRIAPGTLVLDLGCGAGALGRWLRAEKRCVVDGVEANAKSAASAAPYYRKMVVADLETETLSAHFANQRYDYIVCADVLEHLRRPEELVAQLGELLTPSGRILLSIPNVSYAGLIGALLNGEFQYRSSGLLDATHLRFFTRKSLLQWLKRCDLHVTRIEPVTLPISLSEFAADHLEGLPPAILRTLLGLPDALTYQFLVETAPAGGDFPVAVPAVEEGAKTAAFSYLAQLFYRGNHPYDEAHSAVVQAEVGVDRQRLRFAIPPSSELVSLRLDPANRPGYLRLYDAALYDGERNCVWRWDESTPLDHLRSQKISFLRDGDRAGVLLVLAGDDPWFELPLAPAELARLRKGGVLELDVSWPQAPDSFLVIERLLRKEGQLPRILELEAALVEAREQAEAEQSWLKATHEEHDARQKRVISDMRAHIQTLSRELKIMQDELRGTSSKLTQINNSLTFRLGRPLFALVNRLRRPQ